MSSNFRDTSTNNHHLAIPPNPKQGLYIDLVDCNNSILLGSHFFHPSPLGFYHLWLSPVRQVGPPWGSIFGTDDSDFNIGDMKVPTFYSTEIEEDERAYAICMPVIGVVFGGIHCVGWFFNFPSSDEAIVWRVSSAVLAGIPFLLPILFAFVGSLLEILTSSQKGKILLLLLYQSSYYFMYCLVFF